MSYAKHKNKYGYASTIYKLNIYWLLLYASTILGSRNTQINNSSKSLSSIGVYQRSDRNRDKWIIPHSVVSAVTEPCAHAGHGIRSAGKIPREGVS